MTVAYGRKDYEEWSDPTYEKRPKARQAEKNPSGDASSEETAGWTLRHVGSGLPKRGKEKEEGPLAREER